MKKIITTTTFFLLSIIGTIVAYGQNTYAEVDKEFLRSIARQNNNLTVMGLTAIDTANWASDEAWVSKISGLSWQGGTENRHITMISWEYKGITGVLNMNELPEITRLHCSGNGLTSVTVADCPKLVALQCQSNTPKITAVSASGCVLLNSINCASNSIATLSISDCPAMNALYCNNNQITTLDVSGMENLQFLECNDNSITSLNLTGCVALMRLYCHNNNINELNITGLNALVNNIHCFNNYLKFSTLPKITASNYRFAGQKTIDDGIILYTAGIDLSSEYQTTIGSNTATTVYNWFEITSGTETAITEGITDNGDGTFTLSAAVAGKKLRCKMTNENFWKTSEYTRLTLVYEVEVTAPPVQYAEVDKEFLRSIARQNNNLMVMGLTAIDTANWASDEAWVSKISGLSWQGGTENRHITMISWEYKGITGVLNMNELPEITRLHCSGNGLTSVTVADCPKLVALQCQSNTPKITAVSASGCVLLNSINCASNSIATLSISDCPAMNALYCNNNQITTLDVSGMENLQFLECNDNSITSLNLTGCVALMRLYCHNNNINELNITGLNALVNNIHCFNNYLKFSTLPKITASNYRFAGQKTIDDGIILYTAGIDLSSEYQTTIGSNTATTVYNWFEITSGTETAITEGITDNGDGTFTLSAAVAGKKLRCKMTNENFWKTSEYTRLTLVYEVEVTAPPVQYAEVDKEFLRSIARQNNNLMVMGLTAIDTANWASDEAWVSKISGLSWQGETENRHITMISWEYKGITGVLNMNELPEITRLHCSGNGLTSVTVADCPKLVALQCQSNTPKITAVSASGCVLLNSINCASNSIATLSISDCPAMNALYCNNNQITTLDVSGMENLQFLECNDNSITSLNLTGCVALMRLYCHNNNIKELNITGLNALVNNIHCFNNYLKFSTLPKITASNYRFAGQKTIDDGIILYTAGIDLSSEYQTTIGSNTATTVYNWFEITSGTETAITEGITDNGDGTFTLSAAVAGKKLRCKMTNENFWKTSEYTRLTLVYEVEVTAPPVQYAEVDKEFLRSIARQNNNLMVMGLTAIDTANWASDEAWVSKISGLSWQGGTENRHITMISWEYKGITGVLNMNELPEITRLHCSGNGLTSVTVADCPKLVALQCQSNTPKITAVSASGCVLLNSINCASNSIATLSISDCPAMNALYCNNNQITTLDVSGMENLQFLECNDNSITSLNLTGCVALMRLYCHNNNINELNITGLNALVNNIHCFNNYLKFSTLPKITASNYRFAGQKTIDDGIILYTAGIDLSSEYQTTIGSNTATTVYNWFEITSGTETAITEGITDNGDGTFTLSAAVAGKKLRCKMTNENFWKTSEYTRLTLVYEVEVTAPPVQYAEVDKEFLRSIARQNNNLMVMGLTAIDTANWANDEAWVSKISGLSWQGGTENRHITMISWEYKGITGVLNMNELPEITRLHCSGNGLTSVTVADCPKLVALQCQSNTPKITAVSASGCVLLNSINCASNSIATLSISDCPAMNALYCNNNQITTLDVSGMENLQFLECNDNSITSLNLTGCVALMRLYCHNNNINELNITGLNALVNNIHCFNNYLKFSTLPKITASNYRFAGQKTIDDGIILYTAGIDLSSEYQTTIGSNTATTVYNWFEITSGTETAITEGITDNGDGTFTLSAAVAGKKLRCKMTNENFWKTSEYTRLTLVYEVEVTAPPVQYAEVDKEFLRSIARQNNNLMVMGLTAIDTANWANDEAWVSKISGLSWQGGTENRHITMISWEYKGITGVLNMNELPEITRLHCSGNGLTSVTVADCPKLVALQCQSNTPKITAVSASGCVLLNSINCASNSIATLSISDCPAMNALYCNNNQITTLDVSGMENLQFLECNDNSITSLNLTGCVALMRLYCHNNNINELNITGLNALVNNIHCFNNYLKFSTLPKITASNYRFAGQKTIDDGIILYTAGIDLSSEYQTTIGSNTATTVYNWFEITSGTETAITEGITDNGDGTFTLSAAVAGKKLRCKMTNENFWKTSEYTRLTLVYEVEVTAPPVQYAEVDKEFLRSIARQNNNLMVMGLTAIDTANWANDEAWVSKISGLSWQGGTENRHITMISWEYKGITGVLNMNELPEITRLHCSGNGLTSVTVADCPKLVALQCQSNTPKITAVSASGCVLLNSINCASNSIATLSISDCPAMNALYCNNNQITTLDVSGMENLQFLECNDNSITSLNLTGCVALMRLYCHNNNINELNITGLNALVNNIHCFNNYLKFSTLPKITASNYRFAGQKTIDDGIILYTAGIDLSSEYQTTIGSNTATTVYNWFEITSGTETAITEGITDNGDGTFTLSAAVAGKKLRCKMTNENFWKTSEYTRLTLVYEVEVTAPPVQYAEVDKEFLRSIARQNNNLMVMGLTAIDTANWANDEAWVSKISGLSWQGGTENRHITMISWEYKGITGVLNMNELPEITRLHCSGNGLTSVTVADCPKLVALQCQSNTPKITAVSASGCVLLNSINCASNSIATLSISDCPAMNALYCNNNQITTLDVSGMENLQFLECNDNSITSLNLTGCVALMRLYCHNNNINELNITGLNALVNNIHCFNNYLKFSTLPKITASNYRFAGQKTIDDGIILYTAGIDLSSEYQTTIGSNTATTVYNWFEITSGTETAITEGITDNGDGTFTLSAAVAGKKLRCKMTNENFWKTSEYTRLTLVYEVEIESIQSFIITASSGAGGNITPSGEVVVPIGTNKTFTFTADANYALDQVLVDGVNIPSAVTAGSYTFTNVTENHTIVANFKTAAYNIYASYGGGGVITPSGNISVPSGTDQTFIITPNTGYRINYVLVDGVNSPEAVASGSYTFTNVNSEHTIVAAFSPLNYIINATAGTGGSITPSAASISANGDVVVPYGTDQEFVITAYAGYYITEVLVDGVNVPSAVATGRYTFTHVSANHTIIANFAWKTFIITATAGTGGSIAPSGEVVVNYGENKVFTITADQGYSISQVLVDGVNIPTAVTTGRYTFSNVREAHTISAIFVQAQYNIVATAGSNGSINPSGVIGVVHGGSSTFAIIPNTGYRISQVLIDGVNNEQAVNSGSYTFNNVTANHTIAASFETAYFTITATAGAGGTISSAGTTQVPYGGSKFYSFTPNAGYRIKEVLIDGLNNEEAVASGNYLFFNVISSHLITVNFEPALYNILATATGGGTISPPGNTQVTYGGEQEYIMTAHEGFSLTKVMIDGVNNQQSVIDESYTFTNVTANHSIRAIFERKTYTIEAIANTGGTIFPSGISQVNHGASKTYTIVPNAGCIIKEVLIDGVNNPEAVSSGSYQFSNITDNHIIEVNFEVTTFTIIAIVQGDEGGIISPSGEILVDYGTSQTFTMTPDEGYKIVRVFVDGISKPGAVQSGNYTFNNVTTDHKIVVEFEKQTFTITASTGNAGGTITPNGTVIVKYGEDQVFAITPDDGYEVADVLVDGASVGKIESYTFEKVTASHTIVATFQLETAIDEVETAALKVYPNPTAGILRIKNEELKMNHVKVFDINGRLVLEKNNINNNEISLDLFDFSDGVYFLKVDGTTIRIVKY